MPRFVSSGEVMVAQGALRVLKEALDCPRQVMGASAAQAYKALTNQMRIASDAIVPLRDDPCTPAAKALVAEFDRISVTAGDRARRLSARAEYGGPCKSKMTTQEKTKFISQYGLGAYEALPW